MVKKTATALLTSQEDDYAKSKPANMHVFKWTICHLHPDKDNILQVQSRLYVLV